MLETVDKYLSKLKVTGLQPTLNVYRGQSNSKWQLKSSATRHLSLSPDIRSAHALISHHKYILTEARKGAYGVEYEELSDLQLLAGLQHLGKPTGLLDFSRSPLVAMWFATSLDDPKDPQDGKLFAINTNNPENVYRIFGNEESQDISKIFFDQFSTKKPPVSIWEPGFIGSQRNKILAQSSVFVIGPPIFTGYDDIVSEITIEKKDKEKLRSELDYLDINEQGLHTSVLAHR